MEKLLEALLTSPDGAVGVVKGTAKAYKPILHAIFSEIWEMQKDLIANDEYFQQNALAKKKKLDALMAQGFSRQESLLFMIEDDEKIKKMVSGVLSNAAKSVAKRRQNEKIT